MSVHSTAAPTVATHGLLRFALKLDAAVTAANALAYLGAFWLLDGWLGLPAGLLAGAGKFLLAFAAFVGRQAIRPELARGAIAGVIAVNAVWVVDSVLLLAVDGFSPTLAGQVVVAVQAAGVAGLAALQGVGMRRA